MVQTSKYTIGLRYGIITGLVYITLLLIRFHFFGAKPFYFFIVTILSFLVILLLYFFAGLARKKELDGEGEIREIFQSIFIVILIAELFYVLFNLVYFKYVNPDFWDNFKAVSMEFYEKSGIPKDQIEEQMKSFKDSGQATTPMGLVRGYGTSVVIDSIFGFIFAFFLRKKKPGFK